MKEGRSYGGTSIHLMWRRSHRSMVIFNGLLDFLGNDMRVPLSRGQVLVPKSFLNFSDVRSIPQKVSRKAMAENVGENLPFFDTDLPGTDFQAAVYEVSKLPQLNFRWELVEKNVIR